MSERAGETCIKAERDPRRLHLGNNYMSANGQTDEAHFPRPDVGHVRSGPVPDLFRGLSKRRAKSSQQWESVCRVVPGNTHEGKISSMSSDLPPNRPRALNSPQSTQFKYLPTEHEVALYLSCHVDGGAMMNTWAFYEKLLAS